jgi:hypothetical protein
MAHEAQLITKVCLTSGGWAFGLWEGPYLYAASINFWILKCCLLQYFGSFAANKASAALTSAPRQTMSLVDRLFAQEAQKESGRIYIPRSQPAIVQGPC